MARDERITWLSDVSPADSIAWTDVGGTARLVERLLASNVLGVLPTKLTDKPFSSSEVVNARLDPTGLDDLPG